MVTDGGYTCEHSLVYRLVQSLCHTPETKVTLYVNYTSIKKKKNVSLQIETMDRAWHWSAVRTGRGRGPGAWQTATAWRPVSPRPSTPDLELPKPPQGICYPPERKQINSWNGEHAISKGGDTPDHRRFGVTGGPVYREDSNEMLGTL